MKSEVQDHWVWPDLSPELVHRPMANLLTPPGLSKTKYIEHSKGPISNASSDCMPAHPCSLIRTDKGVRMLQVDEFSWGLGFSKSQSELVSRGSAQRTIQFFIGNIYLLSWQDSHQRK